MSPTLLFIVLMHGVAMICVAVATRSRLWTAAAAIVAGGVGLVAGDLAGVVVDGLVVAGALYVGWNESPRREKTSKPVMAKPVAVARPVRSRAVNGVVLGGTVAVALCAGAAFLTTLTAAEVPAVIEASSGQASADDGSANPGLAAEDCTRSRSQESKAACPAATR